MFVNKKLFSVCALVVMCMGVNAENQAQEAIQTQQKASGLLTGLLGGYPYGTVYPYGGYYGGLLGGLLRRLRTADEIPQAP